MRTIEEISECYRALGPATGGQWQLYSLVPNRIHLSLAHDNSSTIFVEGPAASFGRMPVLRGIEHRDDATDVATGRTFGALRITAPPSPHGAQAMEFIAYELARNLETDPNLSNASLIASVDWILLLLGAEPGILDMERQRGLVAECLLLRRLLHTASIQGVAPRVVLDRWWGPSGGKRDFAALGVAIEVKSTAHNSRLHHIASLDQLEPLSEGEHAYLYSIGIKSDPTFERRLPHYIADVMSEMVRPDGTKDAEAAHAFTVKLASAGYSSSQDHHYASLPGLLPNPALPPRLYRVEDLDRLRLSSFKENRLPTMVTAVSYDLDVSAAPLGETETETVLAALIHAPAM